MSVIVQARLDAASQKALTRLVRERGWTPSKAVREGLRLLAATQPRRTKPRIIGLGEFRSGLGDLSTNKKYLKDLGR